MEYHPRNRRTTPWLWVLIVLAAVILIFVVWWAVAAQPPDETVVYPPEERETVRQPEQQEQPQVVQRDRPVNIYVGRDEQRPNVIVVPRDQSPPPQAQQMEQVSLPDRFRFNGKTWEPTESAISGDDITLQDTGAQIQGNTIYAEQGSQKPYNEVYVESRSGSNIYIPYTPSG